MELPMDYNGWRNRETWLVNLWFGDQWESESDVDDTKEFCEQELNKIPNWLQDFVDWSVIDWDELKEHVEDE